MRQAWINQIREHQKFDVRDECSSIFNVCNLHFDPTSIKWTLNAVKLLPGVHPTIFPHVPLDSHNLLLTDDLQEEMDIEPTEPIPNICSDLVWYVN